MLNQKSNQIYKLPKNWIVLQCIILIIVLFLALTRWLPGGDPLNPQAGIGPWVEIGLVFFALILMVIFWGPKSLIAGFSSPAFIMVFAFGLWALLTSLWSKNSLVTLGKSIDLIIMTLIAMGVAQRLSISKANPSKPILLSLSIIILFLIMVSLINSGTLLSLMAQESRLRLSIGYEHPNATANFLATLILICFSLVLQKSNLFMKFGLLSLAICSTYLVWLTNSRTTFVALFFCLALLLLFQVKSKRLIVLLFCAGLILVAGVLIVFSVGELGRFVSSFLAEHQDISTLNGRTELWNSVFSDEKNIKFFGVGFQATRFIIIEKSAFAWGYHLHNSLIEIFISTGFIGLFFALGSYLSSIFSVGHFRQFTLPMVYLIYLSLESFLTYRLFNTEISMFIFLLLIFYQSLSMKKANLHDGY